MIRSNKYAAKRISIAIIAMLLLCMTPLSSIAAQQDKAAVANDVSIAIDGEMVQLDDPLRMLDGRIFVPVALIAEMFDATVEWNKTNEEVTIHTAYGDEIILGIEVPVIYFNDARYQIEDVPFITGGRTYIPLRHVAELLHATVQWDAEQRLAELEMVQRAEVTEDYGLAEISEQFGISESALLKRNRLDGADSVELGAMLQVVNPSILENEAEPFTESDMLLLAKITQVEAGYESYEGQLAVANVILNRVKHSKFPNTIYDVIYSGKQFPPAHNGLMDKSEPNASVLRAVKDALNGKNNVEDAIYFFNPKVSSGTFWSSLEIITTIGHHSFAK